MLRLKHVHCSHASIWIPRYWAVAVPAYLCVAVGVFLCLDLGANLLLVPALDDPRTVTGEDRADCKEVVSQLLVYSQTSDSGPSEIGTQYNKPLYKGHFSRSQIIGLPMVLIHFEPPRRGQPLYKEQKT